jgi:ribosomal protein uL23
MNAVIKYPLSTEKSIRQMESENTLIFIVDKKATKQMVKEEIEKLYKVKVTSVNTAVDTKNRKKAYIKFSDETPAIELATQLGLM